MLFNSYIFVLLFLPITIFGYFIFNHFKKNSFAQLFLLIMSLIFYAYFNFSYLFIIISSIVINYCFYLFFEKVEKNNIRKLLLIISLLFNIGILFYYKYMNFFIDNVNALFKTDIPLLSIVLPLGISFFTFQQISFVVDSYKREVPKYNFLYYASFVTFFPQLVAGPIVTHDELIPQFMDQKLKNLNYENLSKGIYVFALGLSKKVLIADVFGIVANYGFGNIESLNTTNAVIVMLSYTFQIYFDFSGYSDMAIGIGKMFNIELPVNFNSPYKSLSIKEFWARWHMTLTRFFTKYIYIPLGGNRKGIKRTYINIFIIYLISGFWHGANWTFIFWGVLHGIATIIYRVFKTQFDRLHPVLNWMITFSFINISWIFFRADSIKNAFIFINRILQFNFGGIADTISGAFKLPIFNFIANKFGFLTYFPHLALQIFFIVVLIIVLGSKNAREKIDDFKPTLKYMLITVLLLLLCILSFSSVSTFLYFNF